MVNAFHTILFTAALMFVLSACTHNTTDTSFSSKKQDVPEGFGTTIISEREENDLRNEMYEENGVRYYKAGMYGLVIREDTKTLFVDRVIANGIAERIGIVAVDEITLINQNKSINLVAEGFSTLEEYFVSSAAMEMELKRKNEISHIRIFPPINYDFDDDHTAERIYYYTLDNPFTSEIVVLDSVTSEIRESFNIFRQLAFVGNIESLRLDYFNRQSLIDRDGDASPELLLTFQYPLTKKKSENVLLTREKNIFSVVEYIDEQGDKRSAVFPRSESETGGVSFEFLNADEESTEELVSWNYSYTKQDRSIPHQIG